MFAILGFGGWEPVVILLAVAVFVFWVRMLIDAIQNKGLTDGEKIGWVLAIVFLHALGGLLYLLIGRPKRHAPRITYPNA